MLLSIQGYNPSASSVQRWKLEYLSNLIYFSGKNKFLVIGLTETWLKPNITDAQVNIEGYNVYRADRIKRDRGGALLYICKEIPVTSKAIFDDNICEAIFCCCSSTETVFVCAYKPCDATDDSFSNMIEFIDKHIQEIPKVSCYTIILLGDFNFPDLWKGNCQQVVPKTSNEHCLFNFLNKHFLCQYCI